MIHISFPFLVCEEMTFGSIFLLIIIILFGFVDILKSSSKCPEQMAQRQYFKIKLCHRSNGQIISKGRFSTPNGCMKFAREKNGFAFNFSPTPLSKEYFNCHVLTCPEANNLTHLVKDPTFDYYSSYGNIAALENATCIRGLGMFRLFEEKQNYTNAIIKCQENGGDLANIVSEQRTNNLAVYISNAVKDWYKAAYVGLDDIEREGRFMNPSGLELSCFRYRAWSPGHPRNKNQIEDCVILDNFKTWKTVNCSIELPFLCELHNEGPAKSVEIFNINCMNITEKSARRECRLVKAQMNFIYGDEDDFSIDRCPVSRNTTTKKPTSTTEANTNQPNDNDYNYRSNNDEDYDNDDYQR